MGWSASRSDRSSANGRRRRRPVTRKGWDERDGTTRILSGDLGQVISGRRHRLPAGLSLPAYCSLHRERAVMAERANVLVTRPIMEGPLARLRERCAVTVYENEFGIPRPELLE